MFSIKQRHIYALVRSTRLWAMKTGGLNQPRDLRQINLFEQLSFSLIKWTGRYRQDIDVKMFCQLYRNFPEIQKVYKQPIASKLHHYIMDQVRVIRIIIKVVVTGTIFWVTLYRYFNLLSNILYNSLIRWY